MRAHPESWRVDCLQVRRDAEAVCRQTDDDGTEAGVDAVAETAIAEAESPDASRNDAGSGVEAATEAGGVGSERI
jgi:hypothetical protein